MGVELDGAFDDVRLLPGVRGMSGLPAVADEGEQLIPLKSARTRTEIEGACCQTHVEQRFANSLTKLMHAVPVFPLPEDGSLVGMEHVAGDLYVQADLRPREQARQALAGEGSESRASTVLLITDGQVSNEVELIAAVCNRKQQVRFFTMGD